MADFAKTLWSDYIVQALYEDQDLNMMFNRSQETYARQQGGNKIVLATLGAGGSFQRTDNKTVGNGLPLTPADTAKGADELIIYEYTYGPIVVRKLDDIQANRSLLQNYTTEIAQAAKEHIFSTACLNVINNVHADHKLKWTGSSGAKFTFADLQAGAEKMNAAKVLRNNRYCILPTQAETYLSQDDYLKNWFAMNQSAIQEGRMPNLAGFGFAPSTLIALTNADGDISTTPSENTKLNVTAWRKEYHHLVIQTEMEITGSEDAAYLGYVPAFTIRYGLKLERDKAAFQSTQQ